jgi:hypothetical protein
MAYLTSCVNSNVDIIKYLTEKVKPTKRQFKWGGPPTTTALDIDEH